MQARPITSLYPLPENLKRDESLHVLINFNSIQGVTEPLTQLGIDALRLIFAGVPKLLHLHVSMQEILLDAGNRLFLDFTALVRDPSLQGLALTFLAQTDPGAREIVLRLIHERRITPQRTLTPWRAFTLLLAALPLARRVLAAVIAPDQMRPRVIAQADRFIARAQEHARSASDLGARLRAMENDLSAAEDISINAMPTVLPAFAAIPIVDRWLAEWLGEKPGAALELMRGLPGNLTIAMDLKLWAAAQAIRGDTAACEWLRTQPVTGLVEAYRQGQLPPTAQRALDEFLQEYGMRGVAEIDLGRPRWRDDPTPILQTLLAYLQLTDSERAPDAIYRRASEQAERLTREYLTRIRRTRFGWLRAKLFAAVIRRMRLLAGLREAPLFYLVCVNDIYRAALLDAARDLAAHGQLERAQDIFLVPLGILKRFAGGETMDLLKLVAANRAGYDREAARKQMPRVFLSTGEAFYEGMSDATANGNELVGDAVSPGVAEGRVRVMLDPHGAHLELGEILVCASTDPGWTPLFLTAGGLVMEIGGMITHGSVVAREYGIPAVVGVHNATTRLQTGQRVRVDGNRGRVIVLA